MTARSKYARKIFIRVFKIVKLTTIWFFITSIFLVLLYRFVPPPVTPLMLIRVAEQMTGGEDLKLRKDWTSLDDMSPKMVLAVVAAEDQQFAEHWGFDFKAIDKAIKFNQKKKGKKVRGASTISQQTAKNVFLWPGRSWIRKALEVYFTLLIEGTWSKERIMEVYLNEIEMGNGIYGAEMAAQIYFNKSAKNLTATQAASIAAILPNPRKFSALRPSGYTAKRRVWILRNMRNIGQIDLD